MAQKKQPIHNTPKGVAVWPRLSEPDTKFKSEGEYTCKLAFDPSLPDVQQFITTLEQARDAQFEVFQAEKPAHKKFTVAPVFVQELDQEGEETGRITVNFKMKASGVSKKTGKPWKRKPTFFDSKGKEMKSPPMISGGSILRIACELHGGGVPSSKQFYLSPKLVAVKLIELVTYGGSVSAAGCGFDEDEGGYEADDSAADLPFDTDDTPDHDMDDDGGSGDF